MKKIIVRKSTVSGKGGYAREQIQKGEVIGKMTGKVIGPDDIDRLYAARKIRWDDPLELGNNKYLYLDPVPVSINHSCVPNAGIRKRNELFALRDIKIGEEIFYDYSTVVGMNAPHETIDWIMRCKCGNTNCRKRIGNWQSLPKTLLRSYEKKGALPSFVLREMKRVYRQKKAK